MSRSPRPFADMSAALQAPRGALRDAISQATRMDEASCVKALLPDATWPPDQARAAQALALDLARRLRQHQGHTGRQGLVQALLQEFSLSSQEGVALMCMAEALLRIPDEATRDALIRDKVATANWSAHLGQSPSLFVNAATWGLVLTGRLVNTHGETGLSAALKRVAIKGGEPLIRKAVDVAMRLLGEQFVIGETIQQALARARTREAQGFRHSYDMLGEAAMTAADAGRYLQAYEDAIQAIGMAAQGLGIHDGPGISIKLSALHPRYSQAQYQRVMDELYPRLLMLARLARHHAIGLNIDAEESDRLDLSLDLLARLCHEPDLQGWDGIGFVVQAYQKRCPLVLDHLIELARRSGHRLMVRLVKGAYWDSEIKRAQQEGQAGYPVYTRKLHTDMAYLACARKMLAAPAEIYPQFATHNAHTLAAILQLTGPALHSGHYEFQCLHGMGEALYDMVIRPEAQGGLGCPCRIYAPVGAHDTLLAYLVRRLLENGANTSFVHRLADASVPLDELVTDPVAAIQAMGDQAGAPHPAIPLPANLFGTRRPNPIGLDLGDVPTQAWLQAELATLASQPVHALPLVAHTLAQPDQPDQPERNPADQRDTVGTVRWATLQDVQKAVQHSAAHAALWQNTPAAERSQVLSRAARLMSQRLPLLLNLLVREAGKTLPAALSEVREAMDYLHYHAAQALHLANRPPPPLGPVACISPWNFPLAIFIGQISAALAAGNTVLAKPAEQTPLVAAQAVAMLHEAGVPAAALQMLPGPGDTIGAALAAHEAVQGVLFTGSTDVAQLLQTTLAQRLNAHGRPVPLIAETGGQNAMIVDSSALPEQVVQDVLTSAFDSAGQRCSALRVLCVQEELAEPLLGMLRGALAELRIGPGQALHTDVGPVIDAAARDGLQTHIDAMRARGHPVYQVPSCALALAAPDSPLAHGHFIAPTLIELPSLADLTDEVFGPVLHVLRFKRAELGALIEQIHATGYGLTMGIHSRIDETIDFITQRARVGNIYVNRNMVGAVVGVQPFGGEGLSGTGPKAGGPLYLARLLSPCADTGHASRQWLNDALSGGGSCRDAARPASDTGTAHVATRPPAAFEALLDWLNHTPIDHAHALRTHAQWLQAHALTAAQAVLTGPTGERNTYILRPLQGVLCLADKHTDLLYQLATVLAAGCQAVWLTQPSLPPLWQALPEAVRACITVAPDMADAPWDAVLMHGPPQAITGIAQALAQRPGPLTRLQAAPQGWRQPGAFDMAGLMREQVISVNTAAAGGNASLLTLD